MGTHEEEDKLIMDDDTVGFKYIEIITNGLVIYILSTERKKAASFTAYKAITHNQRFRLLLFTKWSACNKLLWLSLNVATASCYIAAPNFFI